MSVKVIKSEWHQIELQYSINIDVDYVKCFLKDLSDEEAQKIVDDLESGEILFEDFEEMCEETDDFYGFDWDFEKEDLWTSRKGGYDVTYETETVED